MQTVIVPVFDDQETSDSVGTYETMFGTAYDEEAALNENFQPREMKILLGHRSENGEPVFFMPNNTECVLHNNIGIIGTMGTGKTQFTKSVITQIYRNQNDNYDGAPIGILIFDYKGDYNETKPDFVAATNAAVIKPYRIPYNPFALNLKKSNIPLFPLHTANSFTDTVSKIYNLGSKQTNTLLECIITHIKIRVSTRKMKVPGTDRLRPLKMFIRSMRTAKRNMKYCIFPGRILFSAMPISKQMKKKDNI